MRIIILCLLIALPVLCPRPSAAQTFTYCGIWFDYDAAGNRIKRYYDCKDIDEGQVGIPPDGTASMSQSMTRTKAIDLKAPTVNPNPTEGQYFIKLPADTAIAQFYWYDAQGRVIASGSFNGLNYSGNIASFPPGNYFLVLEWCGRSYRYKILKSN
jgi:hypothetical protein